MGRREDNIQVFEDTIDLIKDSDSLQAAQGCGAFQNPPEIVAEAFHKVTDEYGDYFDMIEYAVFHTARETANYEAFKRELS